MRGDRGQFLVWINIYKKTYSCQALYAIHFSVAEKCILNTAHSEEEYQVQYVNKDLNAVR